MKVLSLIIVGMLSGGALFGGVVASPNLLQVREEPTPINVRVQASMAAYCAGFPAEVVTDVSKRYSVTDVITLRPPAGGYDATVVRVNAVTGICESLPAGRLSGVATHKAAYAITSNVARDGLSLYVVERLGGGDEYNATFLVLRLPESARVTYVPGSGPVQRT